MQNWMLNVRIVEINTKEWLVLYSKCRPDYNFDYAQLEKDKISDM